MRRKKILKALIICISIYAVFVCIVATLFHHIRYNPIDAVSMTYIRHNTDIQDKYGEIIHIGKNILYKTEKDESSIKSPYTIETKTGDVIVYVTLKKYDEKWDAVSIEIIEVIPNEQ